MFLTRTTSLIYDSLLSLLYPQECKLCGSLVTSRADGQACKACWDKVRLFSASDPVCWKCGTPSVLSFASVEEEKVRCRHCDGDAYTAARACGVYEGALRVSVLSLKREPIVCARLMQLLAVVLSRRPLHEATLIIPVPLHSKREKARGFNQAATLAYALSRKTALPYDENNLIRVSHSERHRAGMDAQRRRETVFGAFDVRYPGVIANERVLLVDDVFTTGATASACAKALLDAGASDVFVLTLARAR
jgi:ComF family protein